MAKFAPYLCFILATWGPAAGAGDDGSGSRPALRKEFHQQVQYPFVFVPESYLVSTGPVPMRYSVAGNEVSYRTPPAPPAPTPAPTPVVPAKAEIADPPAKPGKKTEPTPSPAAFATQAAAPATDPSATSTDPAASPEYPPPEGAPAPLPEGQVDFERVPDEVLDFFRNPYNSVPNGRRLFDPIFDPAIVQKAPASKATYKEE